MELLNYFRASFSELEKYVSWRNSNEPDNKGWFDEGDYWNVISNHPLTLESICNLEKDNWRLHFEAHPNAEDFSSHETGICDFSDRSIWVPKNFLKHGYLRDLAISHEVVHACYGPISADFMDPKCLEIPPESDPNDPAVIAAKLVRKIFGIELLMKVERGILTEWIARKVRANPKMLAQIWKQFNIPARIYDRASYTANRVVNFGEQLLFPFSENQYHHTYMGSPFSVTK